jgi:hypothetical protein
MTVWQRLGRRGRAVGIGVAAALLLVGAAVVLWLSSTFASDDDGGAAAAPGLTEEEAGRLEAGLVDPDPAGVAAVLAESTAAAYLESPSPLVPPEASLTIDTSSFTRTGDVDALVAATVDAGGRRSDVVLFLGLEGDQWRVISSVGA